MAATIGLDAAEQIPQAGPQSLGDLFDVDQGQVPDAPLNAAVIGAVKPASFSSLFLVDFLPFAQTTDYTAKTNADVGHFVQLSRRASDPYTADESHSSWAVFAFRESNLDLANVATIYVRDNASPVRIS